MNKKAIYPKLAWQSLRKNARFYLPYILTICGTAGSFYILLALGGETNLPSLSRYSYLSSYMQIGAFVVAIFSVIFLFYTNSFLMKQRRRELGLYSVLGMGKRHIAAVLAWETLYTGIIGITGGVLAGALLQRAAIALALRMMRFNIYYTPDFSVSAMVWTIAFFAVLLVFCLLANLCRMSRQNATDIMREGTAGEREPRTRWLLAVLGILLLGGGYTIAVAVTNVMSALALYFVAVILVILGTYCLFTAVSIAVLKLLRRNKKFYYKTRNFIGVSGMLYRMKRNAVGLANICILSTMVLVMVSGTLALFIGTDDSIDSAYPRDYAFDISYDATGETPISAEAIEELVREVAAGRGLTVQDNVMAYDYFQINGLYGNGSFTLFHGGSEEGFVKTQLMFMSAADYTSRFGGEAPEVKPGEAYVYSKNLTLAGDEITVISPENGNQKKYRIAGRIHDAGYDPMSLSVDALCIIVLPDDGAVLEMIRFNNESTDATSLANLEFFFDTDGTDEEKKAFFEYLSSNDEDGSVVMKADRLGNWERMYYISKAEQRADVYELNGAFFFLGVFLGMLFIMATALIIYYKQITEGYEDRERFRIMKQVGLTQSDVRRSINSQVLVVFFAPLIVAAVHVAFDFRLVRMLLTLFGLTNVSITLLCTVGTLLGFAAVYGILYALTARAYSRIVN